MKKNFTGLSLDGQAGVSEHGDGFEYSVSGIMGANFDDGRGNVSLSMSTNVRKGALRRDRAWFRDLWRDPTIGGTQFFPDFTGADLLAPASNTALVSVFGATGSNPAQYNPNGRFYFNDDGTPFTGFFQSFSPGGVSRFKGDLTGIKWKKTSDGLLAQNFIDDKLTLPSERYNMLARGNYELNDWIGVFAQGMFSKVSSHTAQEPSPSTNGWGALIPNDGRAIPASLQTLLNSRPDPTAPWLLTYLLDFGGNRTSDVDVFTYNLQAGFEGKIPGTDWTWELFASNGQSETTSTQKGFASLERFRAVVTQPNWGAGFKSNSNATFGGFGSAQATCTSGFNPFNPTLVISKDCAEAISADIKTRSVMTQSVWEFNAQGALFALPAGDLRAAIGASSRTNKYEFLNDTLTTQGRSFLDQAIGLYPSGNSGGSITVREVYGELLVPIIKDSFIKALNLELGARYSDYSTTGSTTTYKALADIEVNDWFRLRGGFNRAVRAPNVAELYLAPQQTFVFSAGGDPCSVNNTLPYSANPASNPTSAAQVKALCSTIMNKFDPTTSATFYANTTAQSVGSAFAFPTLQGNPGIRPETADTWTAGVVLKSPLEGALSTLRLAIDYYNIKVKNAIGAQSIDVAQQQCFSTVYNPTLTASSPYCAGINRVARDGAIGNIITTFYNNGQFQTSGIDVQLDWAADIGPGRFSLNSVFNYLISMKSKELSGNPLLEYAGTLGPNQNGLNPGAYRWKMLNTFGYSIGAANISLQWKHLPSIKSASYAANPKTTGLGAGAYELFNLNGSYSITDGVTIRVGVDNLFNKAPPVLERNPGNAAVGVLPGGTFSSSNNTYFYDLVGRRFYAGASFKF